MEKINAARLVTDAFLGYDDKAVIIAGEVYIIKSPTIRIIAKASHYLCESIGDGTNLKDVFSDMAQLDNVAKAMSVFIKGDESLTDKILEGSVDELVHGIEVAYSQFSIKNFCRLSALRKSVERMIANQKS